MKTVSITLGTLATLAILAGLTVMYGGVFNVSTQWKDPALMRWVVINTRESSIETRAKDIKAPTLGSKEQIDKGFRSFREMCTVCHTPPKGKPSPITKGLNPEPPDLSEEEGEMSDAETFWVIKNGIRMTGMPAWGPTHDDTELWNIVAFLKTLPDMSAEDYQAMDKRLPQGHDDADEH